MRAKDVARGRFEYESASSYLLLEAFSGRAVAFRDAFRLERALAWGGRVHKWALGHGTPCFKTVLWEICPVCGWGR
ncbi:hypothetical protein [Candidatus Alkanophaga liquidiphilum]